MDEDINLGKSKSKDRILFEIQNIFEKRDANRFYSGIYGFMIRGGLIILFVIVAFAVYEILSFKKELDDFNEKIIKTNKAINDIENKSGKILERYNSNAAKIIIPTTPKNIDLQNNLNSFKGVFSLPGTQLTKFDSLIYVNEFNVYSENDPY